MRFLHPLIGILSLVMASASFAGFTRGSSFQFVDLEGELTVYCGRFVERLTCRDTFMEPWPYDMFMGPKISQAKSIELRAYVGNQAQVAVADYNGDTGRSSEINLGVYSLFQKPLLRVGTNRIEYRLYNNRDETINQGSFNVAVSRLPSRRCQDREVHLPSAQDCSYTYTICQQYFKTMNYCRAGR